MARKKELPAAPPNTVTLNVRLSREARAENLSLEGMLADLRELAAADGLTVVGEHVDDGVSGAVRDRPGFVGWLDDVRECRASHMYAHHVDRMTREGLNVAAMILDVQEGKDPHTGAVIREPVRLKDCKGLDSNSGATFRIMFVVKAEMAREERQRIAERVRDTKARLKAAGRWAGGTPPFGWRAVPIANEEGEVLGKVLEIDPAEASFLRECGARVIADFAKDPKKSPNLPQVVRFANGPDGMPPRRAEYWRRVTMQQCLTIRPSSVSEDIFTADERAALRAALAVRTPDARKGGRKYSRLLSGLLRCHSCDSPLQVAARKEVRFLAGEYATYRCQEAYNAAGKCSRPVIISAPALEPFMTRDFLDKYGHRPAYVRRAEVTGAAEREAAELAVNAALADLRVAATPQAFAQLQEAQAAHAAALEIPREGVVRLVPTGRTIVETWEAGDVEIRRDLLAAAYAAIVVLPGKRGKRGIDPARLIIMGHPEHPAGVLDPSTFTPGRVVYTPAA